jgi:hypothetical protein
MPTNQPNSAPQGNPPEPRDDLTAAAVLTDDRLDSQPGGGGLGGQAAAEGSPDASRPQEASTRSTPQTPNVTAEDAPGRAEAEARLQSDTADPHPRSQ